MQHSALLQAGRLYHIALLRKGTEYAMWVLDVAANTFSASIYHYRVCLPSHSTAFFLIPSTFSFMFQPTAAQPLLDHGDNSGGVLLGGRDYDPITSSFPGQITQGFFHKGTLTSDQVYALWAYVLIFSLIVYFHA